MLKSIDPAILNWAVKSNSKTWNPFPFVEILKKRLMDEK
jgi:hypothetical protein